MFDADVIKNIQNKYESFVPYLNERTRRIWAAIEATTLGYGGVSAVAAATGLSRNTIAAGIRELQNNKGKAVVPVQIRQPGAGRKLVEEIDLLGNKRE